MNITFLGNGSFGVPALQEIHNSSHNLLSVVTRPDRPEGRGRKLAPSAVKVAALEMDLPVLEYGNLKDIETLEQFRSLKTDLWVVVAFPIIPESMLGFSPLGIVNLHASLLPLYRGAAPVQWAIIKGESVTGVTTFFIDAGVDTGLICLQREVSIDPAETAGELSERLKYIGAKLMLETIDLVESGEAPRIAQDSTVSSPAPKLNKSDGELDWNSGTDEVINRIRGLNPWPGSFTHYNRERILVLKARALLDTDDFQDAAVNRPPGSIAGFLKDGWPVVVTGDGCFIVLLQLQRAGRQPAIASDVARGLRVETGDRFHSPKEIGPAAEKI